MAEGNPQKKPVPKWDASLETLKLEGTVMTACAHAKFVLIRDAAPHTAQELIAKFGFTEYQADALHQAFRGTETRGRVLFGKSFDDFVMIAVRDAERAANTNDRDEAHHFLSTMLGKSITSTEGVAALKRELAKKLSTSK